MAEEIRISPMADEADTRSRDVRSSDLNELSGGSARAAQYPPCSPFLVQPMCAPAGAGKTHSPRALRAGAARGYEQVPVLGPTGKAVDEAIQDGAGDRGLTVAKSLHLLDTGELRLNARTVIVVDEASMVGTHELRRLLEATTAARVKIVLVGDPYQLAPVKARGGMSSNYVTNCLRRSGFPRYGGCVIPPSVTRRWRCVPPMATGCANRWAGIGRMAGCTPVIRSRWPPMP